MTRREPDSAELPGVERRLAALPSGRPHPVRWNLIVMQFGPLPRRLERLPVVPRLILLSLPAAVAITPSARHSPPPRGSEVQ